MKNSFSMPKNYLALFDEGTAAHVEPGEGAGDGNEADAPVRGGEPPKQAGAVNHPGDSRRERRAGAAARKRQIAEALTGKPSAQTGSDAGSGRDADAPGEDPAGERAQDGAPPESRRAKFRAMVDGEFKDLFQEAVQGIIDRRFRHTKTLEETLASQRPVVEALLAQYGIRDGDLNRLADAIGREASPQEAEPPDRLTLLEQENRMLREEWQRQTVARAADGQYDDWMRQAGEAGEAYQAFDLRAEVQNPLFLSLLKARVPMRQAYEVLHLEDIVGGVARQSAERTEKRVVEGIRAKGARPVENGVSSQNGITIHAGASQLSRRDRAALAARAARGEKITL